MQQVLAIISIIQTLLPALTTLWTDAMAAHATGDQVTLDKLHAKAVAWADTLKPDGV